MPSNALPAFARPASPMHLSPMMRMLVLICGSAMTILCATALFRALAGLAPDLRPVLSLAVIVHVATVVPAVPLGAWLMLSRKGDARHKALGKIWLVLMVTTAASTLFIRQINGGDFSFIHLFVPLTLIGSWQVIASARAGQIARHRRHLVNLYLGALLIPGIFSFLSGRIMGVWLMG